MINCFYLQTLLLIGSQTVLTEDALIENGLVVVGGQGALTSAEFWAPAPMDTHCSLPPFVREMYDPTVDIVQDRVIACYEESCQELVYYGVESGWEEVQTTLHSRKYHTSAVTTHGLLLVGGSVSPTTTELLPLDGGPSVESFSMPRPGWKDHCSIQVDDNTIVLTGGQDTDAMVTEYSGLAGTEEVMSREFPSLIYPRHHHTCGTYMAEDRQWFIVAGGFQGHSLSNTEIMDFTGGSPERWWEVAALPSPRDSLRGANLGGVFHVAGGLVYPDGITSEILAWDPVLESWAVVGQLTEARQRHGVASIPMSAVTNWCTVLN